MELEIVGHCPEAAVFHAACVLAEQVTTSILLSVIL